MYVPAFILGKKFFSRLQNLSWETDVWFQEEKKTQLFEKFSCTSTQVLIGQKDKYEKFADTGGQEFT
jgi:hypothetical protein